MQEFPCKGHYIISKTWKMNITPHNLPLHIWRQDFYLIRLGNIWVCFKRKLYQAFVFIKAMSCPLSLALLITLKNSLLKYGGSLGHRICSSRTWTRKSVSRKRLWEYNGFMDCSRNVLILRAKALCVTEIRPSPPSSDFLNKVASSGFSKQSAYNQDLIEELIFVVSPILMSIVAHLNQTLLKTNVFME